MREGFTNFQRNFVAQVTIDLNISWLSNFLRKYIIVPPIKFSFLFKTYLLQYFRVVLTIMFKFQTTKEVNIHIDIQKVIFKEIFNIHNNIQEVIFKEIHQKTSKIFGHIKILLQQ